MVVTNPVFALARSRDELVATPAANPFLAQWARTGLASVAVRQRDAELAAELRMRRLLVRARGVAVQI